MKRIILSVLTMSALLCGCQKDHVSELAQGRGTIQATIEEISSTRTVMDENNNIRWSEGDQIVGFMKSTLGVKYQVTAASVGKTSASFEEVSSGGLNAGTVLEHVIAYYPYSSSVSAAKSGSNYTLDVILPTEQTYVAGSFGNGAMPMVAVSETNNITFRNVCGGMKLQLKGIQKVITIKVEGKNGELLSGAASVTAYTDETKPTITMASGASTSVTLNCGDGVQLNESTATEFILAMPPVLFSKGFTVTVTDSDSQTYTIETDKANTVFRSSLLVMPEGNLLYSDGTGGFNPSDPDMEDFILKLVSDRNLLQTNVDVATLTVTLGDKFVTEDVVIYDKDFNVLDLPDFKFTAKTSGDYVFWASYGTYNSNEITIKAIDVPIPETPADPQPESTDFKARVLMTEFSAIGCAYSPNMKILLHNALADEEIADKVVLTACHSGLINGKADPAFVKTTFDDFCNITGFPTVNFDMYYSFINYPVGTSEMQGMIDDFHASKEAVAAGIAVNSSVDGDKVIVKATVKAAEDGAYRVGAFLLEDGIYAVQSGGSAEEWMNTHDGVIRFIDSKYYNKSGKDQYFGYSVGNIKKGQTADYVFDWDLDVIWSEGALNGEKYGNYYWDEFVMENLHLVVFVSTVGTDSNGNQYYYVNNVIDCPVNGMTPYEYN